MKTRKPIELRLRSKIGDPSDNGCWPWMGATDSGGYGHVWYLGRIQKAHRASYEVLGGREIPRGLVLDHLCHNEDRTCPGGRECPHRLCVNPDHLEPVTQKVNMQRAWAWKTHCVNDHEFTPENTYINATSGSRICRECLRRHSRNSYEKKKKARLVAQIQ